VPAPLALLLAVATVLSLAWSIAQPPWQGPDEAGHFQYVQRIAEQRTIPWYIGGNCPDCQHGPSTEQEAAQREGAFFALQGNPAMKDTATAEDERAWHRFEDERLVAEHRADGRHNATMRNPPAYYLYETVPYALTSRADIFDRLFALRVANIPLLLVIVGSTWALTGLLLGPRPWLQTAAAGVVALNAQLQSVFSAVNADVLLAAAFSAAMALMALVLLRGATRGRLLALAVATALGVLAHPRGLPLLVPVALTLALAWWRQRAPSPALGRPALAAGALAGAALSALAVLWVATRGDLSASNVRAFGSYLWQFYLPRLGGMQPSPRSDWTWRDVFVDRVWGVFGQFDVFVAPRFMKLMAVLTVVAVVAFLVLLVVRRRALGRVAPVAWVLALTAISYVGALHLGAYRNLTSGLSDDPMITGRYMLALIALLGLGVAALLSWLPRRLGGAAAGLVLSGALALQLAAFGALLARFQL
jgi:hypothetical protein